MKNTQVCSLSRDQLTYSYELHQSIRIQIIHDYSASYSGIQTLNRCPPQADKPLTEKYDVPKCSLKQVIFARENTRRKTPLQTSKLTGKQAGTENASPKINVYSGKLSKQVRKILPRESNTNSAKQVNTYGTS